MRRFCVSVFVLLWFVLVKMAPAQVPASFGLRLQGLRTVGHHGGFKAAAYLPDGTVVLLFDQGDGLRLLKTDAGASAVLAEVHLGAAEDSGVALATDGAGNIYVGGTSSSGSLAGTPGAAFPGPVDNSVNSFVASFDTGLQLRFLSFLGAANTALTGVAATGDAIFATGTTFSTTLPATAGAVLRAPAPGAAGNGFVERLTTDGTAVVYATYLTGSGGSTSPAAIAADTLDHAYVTGSTSSPLFPSVAALQSTMLGTSSGFVSELTPAGDGFAFSTFVAGSGLASIAVDASTGNLLLTGDLSPGEFAVSRAPAPIANTPYQAVLRLSGDGQALLDAALVFPGDGSAVTAGPNGTAWVTGSLIAPASVEGDDAGAGDSILLHLTSADDIDWSFRLGGHPANTPQYGSLRSTPRAPALSADGSAVLVPSTIVAATDPSFAASQTFDLGLAVDGNTLLPNTANDLLPSACSPGMPCSGTGGLLSLFGPADGGARLLLSGGNLPVITVRNAGPGAATGLQLAANGFTLNTDCPPVLAPGALCGALLTGAGPGSVNATASNAARVSRTVSTPLLAQSLAFDTSEFDFGIVTGAGSPVTRSVTVTNLGAVTETFASGPESVPSSAPYALSEAASTCGGPPSAHTLAPNTSCRITLALSAASSPVNDSSVHAGWAVGLHDIPVSGFTQAASLSVSASAINFGPSLGTSTTRLPRFLYLSNPSPFPIAHAPVPSPPNQPFTVNDDCPTTLQPNSVCQIGLWYTQTGAPAIDTLTLLLDEGLSVVVSGETLSASPPVTSVAPLPVAVSPAAVQFLSSVPVSGVSTEVQVVQITNTASAALALSASVLGDFSLQNTCPAILAAQTSCDLGIQFAPSQPGFRQGLLSLSAGPGFGTSTVPLSGTGEPLLDLGGELDVGETPIGEPVVAWFQVGNTLPNLGLAVSGMGFGVAMLPDDGSGHGTLAAEGFHATANGPCTRCWVGVQFLPRAPGAARAMLQVSTTGAGNPYLVAIHGLGLATEGVLLTPAQGTFGALPLQSTSAPLVFTLTNALANDVALQIQQVTATGDFHSFPSNSPQSCTGSLAPTAGCSVQVAFAPTQLGLQTGTLTVVTSAGTVTASLAGTGTASTALAISPTTVVFAQGGAQTVTLTNTGPAAMSILPPTVTGPAFGVASTCALLAVGQSCTMDVSFQPGSFPASGTLNLLVSGTDAGGGTAVATYAVPLYGTGTLASAGLSIFPSAADFGTSATGSLGQVRQFSLTNTGNVALRVSLAASRDFPLATPAECSTLEAGATCTFSAIFLPETAGPLAGTVVASATGADGASAGLALAYLRGYGVSPGAIRASGGTDATVPLDFGAVASGQKASQDLILTNTGEAPVTVRRLSTTAPFQADSNCVATLPAGSSCTVHLVYAPVYQIEANASLAPRADHATLSVGSDASTSADTIYLSGSVRPSVGTEVASSGIPTYTLSGSALTFPNTAPGGRSPAQTLTLFNSGSAPVTFGAIVAPPGFAASTDCTSLAPGASCSIQTAFAPQAGSAPSLQAQTLEIVSDAADALESVSLLGSSFAAPLQLTPTAPDFGPVLLGGTAQVTFTLTNVSTLPVSLAQVAVAGGDYALATSNCPAPGGALPAGQGCTLVVSFNPGATGQQPGGLTVASPDLQQPLEVPLTGTGIAGHLQATPADLAFGTVNLNTQATLTVHLTNTGTAGLTGIDAAITGSDAALFTLGSSCGGLLAVDADCDVQVSFAPVQTGPRAATLTITSSDPGGPLFLPLGGTGAQPPGFLLTVGGVATAAAGMHSGGAAVFPLLVTPQGGYASPVALACTPVHAAPNATCSLSGVQIALASGPGSSSATLSTMSGLSPAAPLPWTSLLLLPGLIAFRRGGRKRWLSRRAVVLGALGLTTTFVLGCGGNIGVVGYPYTPPGTYVYRVTATSTTGAPLTSNVTLTVTVE